MLRVSAVIIFLLFYQSVDYQTIFSEDYDNAKEFMTKNAELFLRYSASYNTDPEIIMPVLFPEAIRYSIVRDYLETKSLEVAYVYSGSADFSIGFFQMKPSFIKNLEGIIKSQPKKLQKYDSLIFAGNISEVEIRKARINRLKQIDYQIAYANCLYEIIRITYPEIFTFDKAFQIKFISTAFNHGFLCGQKEIMEYADKAFFPFNGKDNTRKYIYNEISLYFYRNDLSQIVSKKNNFALSF